MKFCVKYPQNKSQYLSSILTIKIWVIWTFIVKWLQSDSGSDSFTRILTSMFIVTFVDLDVVLGDSKGRGHWCNKCGDKTLVNVPVPGAFKPVEDVRAPGVIDLIKRVSVGFLYSHSVAERQSGKYTNGRRKKWLQWYTFSILCCFILQLHDSEGNNILKFTQ